MGDAKRWAVTYTKHVNQKRKVYQDGVLELHSSNGTDKVLLYDDCEKLLDTKFLKKGDLVGCGETLTFDGFLIDVGDLDSKCGESKSSGLGHNIALENRPNVMRNIKKENERSGPGDSVAPKNLPSVRHNIKKKSEKSDFGKNVAPKNLPSVRCNIKKENGNNGSGNNVAPENHPSVRNNIKREWRVLYTSQKTQKAKKYHDGILRLVVGVFDRKQVVLYDDYGIQLDCRFLKKDEVVECGEALTLDGYLVNIGDSEENCNPLPGSNIQGRAKNPMENIERLDDSGKSGSAKNAAPENCPSVTHNIKREWHALYTTQKTQKAKKYHDGILRLLVGVSQRKQVTLLNEDGTILSSKYLNLSENVRTGSTLELANHLVEVGEAKISQEGAIQTDNTSGVGAASCSSISNVDRMKFNSSGTRNKNTTYGPQNNTSSGKILGSYSSSSKVEKLKFSQTANQILANLKRPNGESKCPSKEPYMQQIPDLSGRNVIDIPEEIAEDNLENLNIGGYAQEVVHRSKISQSEDSQKLSTSDPDNGGELHPPIPSSCNIFLGVTESNSLTAETSPDYPEKPKMNPASNMEGPQVSDIVMSDLLEDTGILNKLVSHDGFDGGVQIMECHLFTGAEVSCGNGYQMAGVSHEKSNQLCADIIGIDSKSEGVDLALPSWNDDEFGNSKVLKNKAKEHWINEFPSFDLGF